MDQAGVGGELRSLRLAIADISWSHSDFRLAIPPAPLQRKWKLRIVLTADEEVRAGAIVWGGRTGQFTRVGQTSRAGRCRSASSICPRRTRAKGPSLSLRRVGDSFATRRSFVLIPRPLLKCLGASVINM